MLVTLCRNDEKKKQSSHDRRIAFQGRAVHQPGVARLVERGRAMLGAAVVPQHRIAVAPAVAIDKAISLREFPEILDQRAAFVGWHAFDVARPTADIERNPATAWMSPH